MQFIHSFTKVKFLFSLKLFMIFSNTVFAEPISTPRHVFDYINGLFATQIDDYPFPTELAFRKCADHIIDPYTESFDPSVVKQGDTIFLMDWYIPWFVQYIHPKIQYPYILISNDSDGFHPNPGVMSYDDRIPTVEATRTLLYDSKVAAWFCKNLLISRHPKLIQIPIGQNIVYWGQCRTDLLMNIASEKNRKKEHLLFLSMSLHTHPIRPILVEKFKEKEYVFCPNYLDKEVFYKELANSFFTLCPPGLGPDTVRFWEAMIFDTIPVIKHYELDDLYADMPVLFVHDWDEVNEGFLRSKLPEIKAKKLRKEKAYFDYWLKKIKVVQAKVRNNDQFFSKVEATSFKTKDLEQLQKILKQYTSSKNKNQQLLCKGGVMCLRPFEIAKNCRFLKKIFVQDSWGSFGHEQATSFLEKYYDVSQFVNTKKMTPISFFDDPYRATGVSLQNLHVFLDLSYLRSTLPEDLEQAFFNIENSNVICGNCAKDPYVQEVLERFIRKFNVQISTIGNIWFLKK